MVLNFVLIVFSLLVICVKTSDAIFLPGIMFPLLIGRGSLYGIFGLIGVGMCYILAVLSLSSMDYLHKRRRDTLNRIETLRNNLLRNPVFSPLMEQMQTAIEDYDYSELQDSDYYDAPIDGQNYEDTSHLYYNPPQPTPPTPSGTPNPVYYQNKYNGPQYRPQVYKPPVPQYRPQYQQPFRPLPYAHKQVYPGNRYANRNRDSSVIYADSSQMRYIRRRPPNRRFLRQRLKRSMNDKRMRRIVAFLLKLNRNSSDNRFMILYKELRWIRHKMV